MAAILGNGYTAGIQAADAALHLIHFYMGVAAQENGAGLQGRQLIRSVQMTVDLIKILLWKETISRELEDKAQTKRKYFQKTYLIKDSYPKYTKKLSN